MLWPPSWMSGRPCRPGDSRTMPQAHGDLRSRTNCSPKITATGAMRMILAGDIGGTNTRLALFEGRPERLRPLQMEVFPSRDFQGPAEIAQKFLTRQSELPTAACFGIAGAVLDGHEETPNLPWVVDALQLAHTLNIEDVLLINDLEANAHGIAVLDESDFVILNPGTPRLSGNRALIAAGTGLGEAGLLAESGGGYRPFASEEIG